MAAAAGDVAREAGWRLRALLRCRKHYSTPQLVKLYKSQLLSFIGYGTPALHHGAPSVLDCVGRARRRFLREVGLSEEQAPVEYRLAPLGARRQMAMMGLIHRISYGNVAPDLSASFLPARNRQAGMPTRTSEARRRYQFQVSVVAGGRTEAYRRSAFGLATIWDMLLAAVVETPSAKLFQKQLQRALLSHLDSGIRGWQFFVRRR